MKHVRRSTMAAAATFVVAGALYVLVRPEDRPVPASSPIPVFVVTTTTTEPTLPSADGPTSETSLADGVTTTAEGATSTTGASTTASADGGATVSTAVVTTETTTG